MRLLRFLTRTAGPTLGAFALVSLLAAAVNAGLVSVVHRALSGDPSQNWALLFAMTAVGRVATTYGMGHLLALQEKRALHALRATLVRRIATLPLVRLERVGRARLIACLNDDLLRLTAAMQGLSSALSAAAVALGGSAYMLYLSPSAFGLVVVLGLLTFAIQRVSTRRARQWFTQASDAEEELQARQRDLVEGLRELQVHAEARHALLKDGVMRSSDSVTAYRLRGRLTYLTARALGQLPPMLAILAVLAGVGLGDSLTDSAGFVLAALYISGSVSAVIGNSGAFGLAQVALTRIEDLVDNLEEPRPQMQATASSGTAFQGLRAAGLCFERDNGFRLGPLDFTITPGEVLFITGDNGSGKSSLGMLLSGLYEPSSGVIQRLDDGAPCNPSAEGLVSAVFGDPYLFDAPWGLSEREQAAAAPWLTQLELPSGKDGAAFPDPGTLSQGQRRRLSLIQALVQDRPLLLLDEFAAHQDEPHRHWFYRELLPQLRAAGKAVVVISHDSAYFDVADQRIHLG